MSDREPEGGEYDVGYRKPPVETRFKEGHKGHPRRKAPRQKSLRDEVLDLLDEEIVVFKNGKKRKMERRAVMVNRMITDAGNGDARARHQVIRLEDHDTADPAPALPPAPPRPRISPEGVEFYMNCKIREAVRKCVYEAIRRSDAERRSEETLRLEHLN